MKLSLALICTPTDKEAKRLDVALSSVKGVFDEIVITQAGPHPSEAVEKVCAKHNAKTDFYTWHDDFAAARQHNFEQCTGDWIVWMDTDDLLQGAENLRKNIEIADEGGVTGLSILYHYSHDSKGNVEDSHWKLQAVKKGFYEWKGVIHEDLLPIKEGKNATIKDVVRVHTASKKDAESSLKRNLSILEKAIKTEPDEPRHYFYLARCYLGTEDWEKVIEVVDTYLTLSNWKEERYDALNMAGEAWMRLGEHNMALKTHSKAILELEDAPDAYIYKARNYIAKEEWLNALTNLEIAEGRDKDATVLKRAALYDHDLYTMSAIAYAQVGMFHAAVQAAERAYTNRQSPQALEILQMTTALAKDEDLTVTYRKLGEQMIGNNERLNALLSTVPDSIADDPRLLALKFGAQEPQTLGENSVVWFCGNSLEAWDGNSVKNGGIGGSETAVIEISKEMAKRGKEVTVFNRCDAPAGGVVIDGVRYMNFWEFNKLDSFNTLIYWRAPQFVDYDVKAKTTIVDMHDTSNDALFTPERLEKIDHVFVKTDYHKSFYPSVPEEKFVVVGNGIDLSRFEIEKTKNPNKLIYTSCASRGLENILDMWPELKKKLPKLELHVFYGWNTFVEAHKHDPAKLQWVDSMKKKMKQDGITNHGRVNQTELAKEMANSTLWVYPTEFPEIHCHPAGTFIETKDGDVEIEKLTIDDFVRTLDDSYKKITAIRSRDVNEDLYTIKPQSSEDFKATGEHPVYAIKGDKSVGWKDRINKEPEWIEVKDLEKDDILLIPRMKKEGSFELNITDYEKCETNNFKIDHNKVNAEMTPEKAWLLGYFAGDGNANTRGKVSFLIADKHIDRDYEKVITALKQLGLPIYERKLKGCVDVYTHSYALSRLLKDKFYINGTKTIPDELLRAYPEEVLAGLVASDGHQNDLYKGTGDNYSFCNTSRYLIAAVRKLLSYRGATGRVYTRIHEHGTKSYTIDWTENNNVSFYGKDDDYIYVKVKKKEKETFNGRVYNIDVEDTHNYLVNGVVAHNCITALEMQAAEVYPITSGYAALAETQQSGVKIEGKPQDHKERYINEIEFAINNPDMLSDGIKKGLDYVQSCTWDKVTDKWLELV